MKNLNFTFTTEIAFDEPVREHTFVLRCLPATRDNQVVQSFLTLEPSCNFALQKDNFGNVMAVGRIDEPHETFTYKSSGTAKILEDAEHFADAEDLARATLFKFPTKLTSASDEIAEWAQLHGFEKGTAANVSSEELLVKCAELADLIHEEMEYTPAVTDVETTASQAWELRRGVCQDFAHIMLAILRYWGATARYVSGLTVGEGATHAWVQVLAGGKWHGFDPTRNRRCDGTYLVCNVGRDFSDCPIERGTYRGVGNQKQSVFMQVEEQ